MRDPRTGHAGIGKGGRESWCDHHSPHAAATTPSAENNYQVKLNSEIEIRAISGKMDQLLHHQWQQLLEIQHMQTEMWEDVANRTQG